MVVRFQTCYTNSTESTIRGSIWKNQEPPSLENFSYYQRYQDSAGMLLSMCMLQVYINCMYLHRNVVLYDMKFAMSGIRPCGKTPASEL